MVACPPQLWRRWIAGGGKHTIKFFTTKRDFDRTTKERYFPWIDDFDRKLRQYGDDIGVCVKEVKDASEAECIVDEDDLYIRAGGFFRRMRLDK